MADPLSLIPEGKEFDELRWTLGILKDDFTQDYAGLASQDSRILSWVKEIQSGGGRGADQIRDDIVKYIMDPETTKKVYGISDEEFQKLVLGGNEGGINFADLKARGGKIGTGTGTKPGKALGVLAGGTTIRVGDKYYQAYEFPAGSGNYVSYQFNDLAAATKALGSNFAVTTKNQTWYNQKVLAEASGEEIIGQKGSWATLTSEIMRDAAMAAGVRDPALAGKMARDPEMQQIMAQGVLGDWTPEQIKAEQRNTNFWKKDLYPGIENLYSQTSEPEQAYADYMRQVTPALQALGYAAGADGTFKSTIGGMLGKKIDSNVFVSQVPTFIRATQNAEFAGTLNAWAERDLGRNIGFNDWFDLMAGESQPELEQVAERATLEWVAQNQGTQLSQGEVEDIAGRSELNINEMQRAISEFNQGILGMGDEALGRYGLTRDEVLSVSAGVSPTSGRTVDEVKLLVAKTAREQGLADDDKINFYVGFNPMGQPIRPGLQSLSPEGA